MGPNPSPQEVAIQFKEILKSNGITSPISEVLVQDSGIRRGCFGSLTEWVTVKFVEEEKPPLQLFVKRKICNEEGLQELEEWKVYEKEVTFYLEYVPRAREYCKLMGHEELLDIYPKCYYADDRMIVLDNLVLGRGFLPLDNLDHQDFDEATFALTTLAKHHAISYALINELGGADPFFKRFPQLKDDAFMTEVQRNVFCPTFENAFDANIKILEIYKCDLQGRDKAIEILNSLKDKFDLVMEHLNSNPDEFLVLNHGDYWNNNMMFLKDKDTDQIKGHVAVDFQTTRYASPYIDLGHYLFTTVKPQVRRERKRDLLKVYLDALKAAGNELGHPIRISLDELDADVRSHFNYGFWSGLCQTMGAGYKVMQDFKIDMELDNAPGFLEKWDELVERWVEEHPEDCRKKAENIIDYVKDYERLTGGVDAVIIEIGK